MTNVLLLLYGLCAWGAACNSVAWARLLWQRWRSGDRARAREDIFLVIRMGMLLSALGTVGLAGDRVSGHLLGEMRLAVPSAVGLASITLMALAEIFFLHVAALNAKARGQVGWARRVYAVGAAAWATIIFLTA